MVSGSLSCQLLCPLAKDCLFRPAECHLVPPGMCASWIRKRELPVETVPRLVVKADGINIFGGRLSEKEGLENKNIVVREDRKTSFMQHAIASGIGGLSAPDNDERQLPLSHSQSYLLPLTMRCRSYQTYCSSPNILCPLASFREERHRFFDFFSLESLIIKAQLYSFCYTLNSHVLSIYVITQRECQS